MLKRLKKNQTINLYKLGPAPSTRNARRYKYLLQTYNLRCVNYFSVKTQLKTDNPKSPGLNLDENHQELADEFINRDSDLITRQSEKIARVIEKSEAVLQEELDLQKNNAQSLTNIQKQDIIKDFNEMASLEIKYAKDDIKQIIATRDDVLSLNDGRLKNDIESDYESDYESQTSLDLFNGLDNHDSAQLNKLDTIADRFKNEFGSLINQTSDTYPNETSLGESSTHNNLKRGLDEDSPVQGPAKRFKQDSSDVLPSGEEPFDFSED